MTLVIQGMTAEYLRATRKELGITQTKLATICRLPPARISEYELGTYPISLRTACLFREAFNIVRQEAYRKAEREKQWDASSLIHTEKNSI